MARLLIVEDEKNLAEGMKFNFELEGYEVVVVGEGSEALAHLARLGVVVVLAQHHCAGAAARHHRAGLVGRRDRLPAGAARERLAG